MSNDTQQPESSVSGSTSGSVSANASHRKSRYASYTVEDLKRRKRQFMWILVALIIVALILAWASFGMMMRTGFLPVFDLGYSWFDEHIVSFFGITKGRTAA